MNFAEMKARVAKVHKLHVAAMRNPTPPAIGPEQRVTSLVDAHNSAQRTVSVRGTAHVEQIPQVALSAENRDALVLRMRSEIDSMPGLPLDYDLDSLDDHLETCRPCEGLSAAGCRFCSSCQDKWSGWRKQLLSRMCSRFTKSAINSTQPQMEVNDMFVYLFQAVYTTAEEPAKKKALRVVAGDLRSVIDAVERAVPGAIVVGAPQGMPVDAIAANVVPAEVEVSPVQPQPAPGPMPFAHPGPQGMMMMPPGTQ